MSPQRRKGRGGGSGKTIAPPPSSLIPSPSALNHNPSKSCSVNERRHATSVHPIIVSDNSAVKLKAQIPQGTRYPSSDRASAAAPSSDRTKNPKNFVIAPEKSSTTTSVAETRLKARSSSAMRPRTTDQEKSKTTTETELRPPKPRSSSAVKPRLHTSDQANRDSLSSIRTVSLASDNSTSNVATRRASVPRLRAESRPRTGRASSPSLMRKEGTDKQTSDEFRARMCRNNVEISQRQEHVEGKSISVCGADGKRVSASKVQLINGKEEEGKRVSAASSRLEGSSCSTTTMEKFASKSSRVSIYQKANKAERWSTTALPVGLTQKINGKLGLPIERTTQGNPRTKGKNDVPPAVEKFSSSAMARPSRNSIKLSCEMEEGISTNKSAVLPSQISSNTASGDALQAHEVQLIDSSTKSGTFRGSLKGKEPGTVTSSTSSISMHQHGIKDDSGMSSSLHRRLAHLEGKVSQIAAELKRTRSLLDSDSCAGSVSVLSDIHNKIATLERAMPFTDCDDIASLDDVIMEDEFPTVYKEENARNSFEHFGMLKNLYSSGTEITSKARLQGSVSAPPRFSQLNEDQRELEDRLLPHGQLLKSRLSLSVVKTNIDLALHAEVDDALIQVNLEGSKPTSSKDMAYATTEKYSEAACTQDVNPLNNVNSLRSSAQSLISTGGVDNKKMESDIRSSHGSEMQLPCLSAENSRHYLQCDETLPSNSFHENVENVMNDDGLELEYAEDVILNELRPIGDKVAVAGWYASDGEAILLAHDDGSCSYHDVANMEEKVVYSSPDGIAMPLWNDCWLVRAAGSDGRSNKFVVAATTGSATGSGFCSWDFYNKSLSACHVEAQWNPPSFTLAQGSKSYSASYVGTEYGELPQWWYNPSGPLLASVSNSLKRAVLYDIRDGEAVLEWDINTDVARLDYCSPVQWRERGKLVLAEQEAISVWDVNTMNVDCLHFIELPRKRISAVYVYNSDAECSGGVRQRLSSSETEAFDGICCTQDDINVLDFRVPSGIGISFPNPGHTSQSVYARQDMVLVGGLDRELNQCRIQQWSVRKGMQFCAYAFEQSGAEKTPHNLALSQVWGSSSLVMAVNGDGLSIFKTGKQCEVENVKDVVTSEDLSNPSFDYSNSRVLLISRDRPATWSLQ